MENKKSFLVYSLVLLSSPCSGSVPTYTEPIYIDSELSEYERCALRLSIPRPHCPIDGKPCDQSDRGVTLNGKKYYFYNYIKEAKIREFFTGQEGTAEFDITANLIITQANFDAVQIRQEARGRLFGEIFYNYFLIINGRELQLFHDELFFLFFTLGRHFGLTDEVLQERFTALLEPQADEPSADK
ncbi:MAG: hypothetical protein LBJ81_03055 [Puniceicoccales bacterium]|jgi:hypothetical protein|nr:hypothetical protein [Puniceicoccales bacterium]